MEGSLLVIFVVNSVKPGGGVVILHLGPALHVVKLTETRASLSATTKTFTGVDEVDLCSNDPPESIEWFFFDRLLGAPRELCAASLYDFRSPARARLDENDENLASNESVIPCDRLSESERFF